MTITEASTSGDRRDPAAGASDWLAVAGEIGEAVGPDAAEHDRRGDFVHDAFALLRQRGITSMLVPAQLGGGGASHADACAVITILGRFEPAVAVTLAMHAHLVAAQVWRHHHDQPGADAILRRVAAERLVLVSTGAADWTDSSGSATRVDGGYRVTARKAPSSGAPTGDVLVTSIRWEGGPDGPAVLHCSVPFSADGVSVDETWDSMGLRATGSHTVVLDDVFVPDAAIALVRPAGRWHPVWNTALGAALPLIMSAYLGIGEQAAELALQVARRNSEAPHVAPLIGEMHNALATAQDAIGAMIAASDDLHFVNSDEHAVFVLTRKTVAAEALITTVRRAVDLTGGLGYSRHCALERLLRDVHGGVHHPLPAARQVRFTGRLALGLDPL